MTRTEIDDCIKRMTGEDSVVHRMDCPYCESPLKGYTGYIRGFTGSGMPDFEECPHCNGSGKVLKR